LNHREPQATMEGMEERPMTESAWFTVVAPESMLAWVASRCSERKLRLFAAACCRRVAHRCRPRFDSILHRAEAIADASDATRSRKEPMPQLAASWMKRHESGLAHALSNDSGFHAAREASERSIEVAKSASDAWWEERWFQAAYLCDIIGNPFRGVALVPEWRTSTVVAMAKQMYESRDFGATPILADALQEAGCESEDILNHCRDPHASHVRGCWVVDLVLGKT
jgi:hypothetical protein